MGETGAEAHEGTGVFDLARRGYDRRQVDDHVANLLVQLSEAERARRDEEHRAVRAEAELAQVRERLQAQPEGDTTAAAATEDDGWGEAGSAHHGFGFRVEKLLRAAEQEAGDTRDSATREASALLEQARADAESHRHEVEQSLVARNADIDKKAARRKVELDERERLVAEQAAAAREKADRALAEARQRAEQIESDARAQATVALEECERAIEERRAESGDELTRLRNLRSGVRGDLGRMLKLLAHEFEQPESDDDQAAGDAGSGANAGPGWFGGAGDADAASRGNGFGPSPSSPAAPLSSAAGR